MMMGLGKRLISDRGKSYISCHLPLCPKLKSDPRFKFKNKYISAGHTDLGRTEMRKHSRNSISDLNF